MTKDMLLIRIFLKEILIIKIKKNLIIGLEDTINWYLNNKDWLKSILKTYNYKRLGLID